MLEDLKGSIRVFCRSRPITEDDTTKGIKAVKLFLRSGHKNILSFGDDEMSLTVTDTKRTKTFSYDRVFGPTSSQEDVFRDTSVLDSIYSFIDISAVPSSVSCRWV
jgi:hypothetical protein